MLERLAVILIFVVMACSTAAPLGAQTPSTPVVWSRGTTVNVFGGAASASSETGPLAGGAFGWEVTPRIAVEGSASWLDRRRGAEAFAADLKALVNLIPGRSVVPFVQGGVGVYRASFDVSRGRLPDFYEGRGTGDVALRTLTFTDPSIIVGGGVNLFLTRHVAVRPDVDWKIVRSHSQNYVVTAVNVHLSYHFEDHPITPSRVPSRP